MVTYCSLMTEGLVQTKHMVCFSYLVGAVLLIQNAQEQVGEQCSNGDSIDTSFMNEYYHGDTPK